MDLGLYIAAQGMLAEQVRQDNLASDLSNASTPGYKPTTAVQQSFGAILLANAQTGTALGTIDTGVKIAQQKVEMGQGTLESTGSPLDFAISGSGFFAVRTPQGVQYTRDGQFTANAQGLLVDQFGDEVLSQNGAPIAVGARGTVPASALGVFNVPGAAEIGNNNFSGTAAGAATGTAQSGRLEQSAVDPIETLIGMTTSLQNYQAGQKAIETIQQTMQENAGTVGLIQGGS
ncbi:MAG: flagellar hook-basal body protein [Solirubrobacteraceae bacterium]